MDPTTLGQPPLHNAPVCETLTGFPVPLSLNASSDSLSRPLLRRRGLRGLFQPLHRGKFYPGAEFEFTGLAHKASQLFEPGLFDGDVNAIVDFKYSTDPRLTWWFDHHQSAFLTPEDAAHYRADTSGRKMYDPTFRSCTQYIATVAKEKFGFEAPDLSDLVKWADIVDGAQYDSAKDAVDLVSRPCS